MTVFFDITFCRVIVEHARGTARRERGYAGSSRRRSTWMDRYIKIGTSLFKINKYIFLV